MMLPVVALTWSGVAEWLGALLAAAGVWHVTKTDPMDDLTERVRHPWRWRLHNPIRAIRRKW